VSSFEGCLTVLKKNFPSNPKMSVLLVTGILAIGLGLALLLTGGEGHKPVRVSLREGSIMGQAWLIVLVLGFTLIALDMYLSTLN